MIDWGVVLKIAVSVLGLTLVSFGQSYTQNPQAATVAHGAAIAISVGSYLVGLFQAKPSK